MTMGKTKKKDHRSASLTRRQSTREVKQSFLIVCEGVRTEPDYFKAFRMTAATVKAVGQAMNTTSLVSKAISIRDADQKKKRTYDQCWVVFDKDDFPAKDFNVLSYPYVKSFETASPVESCVLAIDWLIANGHFNKEYYNEENNVQ